MQRKKSDVLSSDTINELKKLGSIGMTINDVVRDLLLHVDTCDNFWENRC